MKALLWDLDGTLVDSAADIAAAVDRTLVAFDLPPLGEARVRLRIGHGAAALVAACVADAGGTGAPPHLDRFLAEYRARACERTRVHPPALRGLLDRVGVPMGIVTNKPEDLTHVILARLELTRYFPVVIGGDTLPVRKPDPAPVHAALFLLGATGGALVGDGLPDVEAGRAAGLPVIGVGWGIDVPAGADHQVSTVEMLEAVLLRMSFLR